LGRPSKHERAGGPARRSAACVGGTALSACPSPVWRSACCVLGGAERLPRFTLSHFGCIYHRIHYRGDNLWKRRDVSRVHSRVQAHETYSKAPTLPKKQIREGWGTLKFLSRHFGGGPKGQAPLGSRFRANIFISVHARRDTESCNADLGSCPTKPVGRCSVPAHRKFRDLGVLQVVDKEWLYFLEFLATRQLLRSFFGF
jgi:hypothetical protein